MEGSQSIYGLKAESVDARIKSATLDSLILGMLPPLGYSYIEVKEKSELSEVEDARSYLLLEVLNSLKNNAGFHIPEVRISCEHGRYNTLTSNFFPLSVIWRWIQHTCLILLHVILNSMAFFRI